MKTLTMLRRMACLALSMTHCLEALVLTSTNTDPGTLTSASGYDNILVFAMGKVGSSTMVASLGGVFVREIQESYPAVMKTHRADVAKDYMQKLPPGRNTLVIGLVRNPFAQQESLFFELIMCCYHDLSWEQAQHMSLAQLSEQFPKHVKPTLYNWYWRDFAEYTGVDIMKHEFDFHGHQLFVHDDAASVSVLVLRLEDIDHWEGIMKQHLPDFALAGNVNDGSKRVYRKRYQAFRTYYAFPPSAIQAVQSHDSFHFYTKEEQEMFESMAGHPAHLRNMFNETIQADPDYAVIASQKLSMGDLDLDVDEEY